MRAVARVWTLLTEGVGLAWLSSFGSWLPLVDGGADNVGERGDRSLAVGAPPHWRPVNNHELPRASGSKTSPCRAFGLAAVLLPIET